MKKLLLPFLLLGLVGFMVNDAPLTKAEKAFATKELKQSADNFKNEIKGLSQAQLDFKPSPDAWSIAEAAEHLALSETLIWSSLNKVLATSPDPARRSEVKNTDMQVIGMITDRSNKIKTQEAFEPTGKFGSIDGIMKNFQENRKAHIKYVRKTGEDLRNHYQQFPFGTLDAYQLILFMSGHTNRHVAQMKEIKMHPDYPIK
jgi:hypothetical protein